MYKRWQGAKDSLAFLAMKKNDGDDAQVIEAVNMELTRASEQAVMPWVKDILGT